MPAVNNNINLFHQKVFAMNTQLDVVFWGNGSSVGATAFRCIVDEVEQLENIISRYRESAELYKLNQSAYMQFVDVSKTLWNAIEMGIQFYKLTNGYFNIALGKVFHEIKSGNQSQPVYQGAISELISMDKKCHAISFLQPDVLIDFGGMGKGMALQKIANILDNFYITNAFISFGGSSVLTRGSHPHGTYWPFSLADQELGSQEWKLNNDSLSVSRTTRQVGQKNEVHIVDPKTQQPVTFKRTAVVQAYNPIHAEVLSTALLASPPDEQDAVIRNFEVVNHQIL